MTKQTVTPGKSPLVWSTIDDAFEKINANFTELYASIGETGSIGFDALETDLIPSQNDTYDLGSPNKRWASAYISRTLMIGGAAITNEGLTIDLPSGTTVGGNLIIDQNKTFFKEINVNSESSIVADQFNDTVNFQGGTAIDLTINSSSDTIIIDNAGVTRLTAGTAMSVSSSTGNVVVNNAGVTSALAGLGISVNSAAGAVTFSNAGIVDIDGGTGITVGLRDPLTGKVIITNSAPAGNTYRIFATAGEPSLTARSSGDTITFIEGSGINIVNAPAAGALTNRVTFENTGVLSITAGAGLTVSAVTGAVTVSFNNRTDIIGSVFADDSIMLVDGTNGRIVGPVFANVTGDVIGNTTGYHVGDVKGSVFGDDSGVIVDGTSGRLYGVLTGNTTGYHTGDVTGSVFGDNSTMLVDGTNSRIVGPVESATVVASSYIQTGVYVDQAAITTAFPVPTKGMIVFDDGLNQFKGFDGSSWVALN
jgi:hypothetical protein